MARVQGWVVKLGDCSRPALTPASRLFIFMHIFATWLDRLAILVCRHRETCFVRTRDRRYALRCLACGAISPGTEP